MNLEINNSKIETLGYDTVYLEQPVPDIAKTINWKKSYWNRARPNQLASYFGLKIDVLVTDTHHTASYPSGHTVYASLSALILKDMYPQIDTFKLDGLVKQTARARVLQGVHYPSDNNASIIFSTKIYNLLQPYLRK